jgi:hypothetical protein
MISTSHEIIRKGSAEELIGHRDRALEYYKLGLEWIRRAYEAQHLAAPGSYFPRALSERYSANCESDQHIDGRMKEVTKQVDCSVWTYLIGATDLQSLMDADTLKAFREQVQKEPPLVTVDNLIATLTDLRDRRGQIFQQSIVNLFRKLDRGYANNDAYRLNKKLVFEYCWRELGYGFYGYRADQLADLDRAFHVLDGKTAPSHLNDAKHVVGAACHKREQRAESEYFKFELYKNGNLHVVFKRPDLVAKANKIVADFYGETLADARRAAG